MRIGGFALVGLAVVAALVGLFTLATGGEDTTTDQALAPAPTETVAPAPAPAPTDPAAVPAPTTVPPIGTPAPVPSEEPIAPYTPESEPDTSVSTVKAPLRVYNNSRIQGLAERAADDFRSAGWQVESVGNYNRGVIPTSTVYYQPGNEAAARALADEFGMRANPGFDGLQFGGDGLVVIVTREYGG